LTTFARTFASVLLAKAVRYSPGECRVWGEAMLRELDFIDGDWSAVAWAMGSTGTIVRYAVPCLIRAGLGRRVSNEGNAMKNSLRRQAGEAIAGVHIGALVVLCVFLLLHLFLWLVPWWQLEHMPWVEWLSVILLPEILFVGIATRLWRRRRAMAGGILVGAVALVTHFIVHIATHG
jgi:hypothetical protein